MQYGHLDQTEVAAVLFKHLLLQSKYRFLCVVCSIVFVFLSCLFKSVIWSVLFPLIFVFFVQSKTPHMNVIQAASVDLWNLSKFSAKWSVVSITRYTCTGLFLAIHKESPPTLQKPPYPRRLKARAVGLGTGTDNRTGIFYRYFTPEPVFCTGIPEYTMLQWFALSLFLYKWPQSRVWLLCQV